MAENLDNPEEESEDAASAASAAFNVATLALLRRERGKAKSKILYDYINKNLNDRTALFEAAGAYVGPSSGIAAMALNNSQIASAVTNAIIDYFEKHVTTKVGQQTLPAPGPVVHPHVIPPLKLNLPKGGFDLGK